MSDATPQQHHDLIPLADRIRYMQTFRFGAALALLACWLTLPAVQKIDPALLGGVTAATCWSRWAARRAGARWAGAACRCSARC